MILTFALLPLIPTALAAPAAPSAPLAWSTQGLPALAVDLEIEAPDPEIEAIEDARRAAEGLPRRFAVPHAVEVTPAEQGAWHELPDGRWLWRHRVRSPGAANLNFGFTRYWLPPGATLWIYGADGEAALSRPFTERDNKDHGELWTPILDADDVVIELVVPAGRVNDVELHLGAVNPGYRRPGDGASDGLDGEKSGACNVNVICEEGDDWQEEIATVGMYGLSGWYTCTGFMVNNTSEDEAPLFQTAYHCEVSERNASSMVVYWNFEAQDCEARGGGSLDQWQSGATFRARSSRSDFALVELDDLPDTEWQVSYAGWDRSGDDATSAVAIHHPNLDEKAISFEYEKTSVTSYYGNSSPGDGTHVRVADWDVGTTEGGSSGSPLFDQNGRVIGQLHGGGAACGNNESDWYGLISVSWDGNSADARLQDWLDPQGTGQETTDTLSPWAGGLRIEAPESVEMEGPEGGPFEPAAVEIVLTNRGDDPIDYSLSLSGSWLEGDRGAGTVSGDESVTLTLEIADPDLAPGRYEDVIVLDAGDDGYAEIPAVLYVGTPEVVYEWTLDQDPGWQTDGAWAFGRPEGGGGSTGSPDPDSAYSGENVYGYNLSGDYSSSMDPQHLVTEALDLSSLSKTTLGFWRWLGVEDFEYDEASVSVSDDGGATWTSVWEHTGVVNDGAWVWSELDLSAWDGEPEVYVRWSIGPSDDSVEFCGWNIDDVQISAISGCPDDDGDGFKAQACGGTDCDDSDPSIGECDDPNGGKICGCQAGPVGGGWLGLVALAFARRSRRSS